MARRAFPRHRGTGFTLLEALLALTILAFVTGLGVPAYGTYLRSYRLHREA